MGTADCVAGAAGPLVVPEGVCPPGMTKGYPASISAILVGSGMSATEASVQLEQSQDEELELVVDVVSVLSWSSLSTSVEDG